jgi:catechol 2,3-dioxygenase-like lactoylglutathione lyase family enzyme
MNATTTPSTMTRRQLIHAVGVAAVGAAVRGIPASAAEKRALQAIAVNHISYQVNDYTKIRDLYADLLGMTVSHDDGKQCYLAFGDTFIIARNKRSADATAPLVDHIAYTIDNWDKVTVEAALRGHGLNPTPDTDNSFHVKDPDGFDLQIAGKDMRPEFLPEPAVAAAGARRVPNSRGVFKAVAVNHISYQSSNFAITRDFYVDVLGMKVFLHTSHTGEHQTWLAIGDGFIIPRTSRRPDMKPPLVDHIAYTIENWDRNAVESELKRRGFDPRPDTDDSFIVKDPEGFGLQISGSNMKP